MSLPVEIQHRLWFYFCGFNNNNHLDPRAVSVSGIEIKELGINPAEHAFKAAGDHDTDWFRLLMKFWGQEKKGASTLKSGAARSSV